VTVYVDDAIHPWRGMKWCHLFSADLDELHEFAGRLGLKRAWFQQPPKASWPHYDTIAKRRGVALGMGAVAADRWTTMLISTEAQIAWCKVHRPEAVPLFEEQREKWRARHEAYKQKSPA
jgi:hypothetical protein